MPAQTVMQVRRDSAANWSSTNPVLANGEMGYDTTNKLFKVGDGSTAWNSLRVMAQHNTGSAARPLLTDGAYLSGSGLVLSGLSGNYASAPDSAALSITGDIDIKVKVALTDWTPAANTVLTSKEADAVRRSYRVSVLTDGTVRFNWSEDGSTSLGATSTAATGFTDGNIRWVRATLDVNNGAAGRDIKFYTSTDGTTWTQLGTTVTQAGITSIHDNTSVLEVGSRFLGTSEVLNGTVYDVVIQSAYDTADNTTSLVFDANFETATADALAFTESSGNAATVTINTTRYFVGMPDAQYNTVTTGSPGADTTIVSPFRLLASAIVDLAQFEVTTAPSSTATAKIAVFAADANFQATGAALIDFGSITVATSTTGLYTKQVTPVTLQPGVYVVAFNTSVNFTMRQYRGGLSYVRNLASSSPFPAFFQVSQTNSTFPATVPVFNAITASTSGQNSFVSLRWKAA